MMIYSSYDNNDNPGEFMLSIFPDDFTYLTATFANLLFLLYMPKLFARISLLHIMLFLYSFLFVQKKGRSVVESFTET